MLRLFCFGLFVVFIALFPLVAQATNPVNSAPDPGNPSRDILRPPNDLSVRLAGGMIILEWSAVSFADTYIVEFTVLPYNAFIECTGAGFCNFTSTTCTWTANEASFLSGFNTMYFQVRSVDNPTPGDLAMVRGGVFNYNGFDTRLSSFVIDRFEVTQSSYLAVMGSNPSAFTSVAFGPAEQVSWYHAIAYCNLRSMRDNLNPCYSYVVGFHDYGTDPASWPLDWDTNTTPNPNIVCSWSANGYRLPTWAEWEFAALGGTLSQHYTYSGSNVLPQVAWWEGNSSGTTHHIGTLAPNELGLQDMNGNVSEWTWDAYTYYPPGTPLTDPHHDTGQNHLYKGGSWGDSNLGMFDIFQFGSNSSVYISPSIGFRVCRKY